MAKVASFTIELNDDLAAALSVAAQARGWTPESLVTDCVAQHLETAIRHRVLIERMEQMDGHLVAIAQFVGEAGADGGSVDLSRVCRYRPEGDPA